MDYDSSICYIVFLQDLSSSLNISSENIKNNDRPSAVSNLTSLNYPLLQQAVYLLIFREILVERWRAVVQLQRTKFRQDSRSQIES